MKAVRSQRSRKSNNFLIPSLLYALLLVIMFWGEGRASAQHPVDSGAASKMVAHPKTDSPTMVTRQSAYRVDPLSSLASTHVSSSMQMKPSGILVGMAGLMMLMLRAGRSLRQGRSLPPAMKQA